MFRGVIVSKETRLPPELRRKDIPEVCEAESIAAVRGAGGIVELVASPWDHGAVRSEPLDDAASHLAELADEVESSQGHLRLTRAGRASLVLLTEDEFASMQETIALAGDPVAQQEIAEADAAYAEGDFVTGDELRARFGLPPRVA